MLAFLDETDRKASLRAITSQLKEWPGHSIKQIEERIRAALKTAMR